MIGSGRPHGGIRIGHTRTTRPAIRTFVIPTAFNLMNIFVRFAAKTEIIWSVRSDKQGWWTFWFPTHAEKNDQFHLLHEWEDRIAAAVKPRARNAAYELSWSMNVLPLLPEDPVTVAEILRGWFEQSAVKDFGAKFADAWRRSNARAVSNLSAIVTWSKDGAHTYDIKPAEAVDD